MNDLLNMVWVEARKALRSRMPLWTAIGSLFMPLGIAFLIFVARNPDVSRKLGLISAKANLMAYAGTDWTAYLGFFGQLLAVGGFFLFVLAASWLFGREFVDGTVKDMLAVPVSRANILLAKFLVFVVWSLGLCLIMVVFGFLTGVLIGLPGNSPAVIADGLRVSLVAAVLAILVVLPFALFASMGRGYLLPVSLAVLIVMLTNIVALAGWGDYFPWAVPAFYAQGKTALGPASFWIVILTGLAGVVATLAWWNSADQNR